MVRPTSTERDGTVDASTVEGLCVIAAQYRRSYHRFAASVLLPTAVAHLDVVMPLLPAEQPRWTKVQLLTAAGEMATLAGVLLGLDASRYQEAMSYLHLQVQHLGNLRRAQTLARRTATTCTRAAAQLHRDVHLAMIDQDFPLTTQGIP